MARAGRSAAAKKVPSLAKKMEPSKEGLPHSEGFGEIFLRRGEEIEEGAPGG